uniref:Glycosyl transferase family 1 domain-containing protein n=1 Tax=Rhizochromulina marina TaxID=1034831 RepID=A0A7S2RW49_9STRA|mmetsp:Transcript_21754/g.63304  ORF Transcript_21754/g.63304 Transcript_21754/m.63304 type:complete len:540 (+) Transcript_21754:382-2001(+)
MALELLSGRGQRAEWWPTWELHKKPGAPQSGRKRACVVHGSVHERLDPVSFLAVDAVLEGCLCDITVARVVFDAYGLPQHWGTFLRQFDVVITSSKLHAGMLASHGVPALAVPEPIVLPAESEIEGLRRRGERRLQDQGVPAGAFVFLSVFAYSTRKAPIALLQTFLSTFNGDPSVVLVIKTSFQPPTMEGSAENELEGQLRSLPNVVLYSGEHDRSILSREEYLSLVAAADVFVLPSHAEGFCRPCMEAAGMGKPTILTGWGGHTDVLSTSLLVNYTLAPVRVSTGWERQYRGLVWATADEGHLAQVMLRVRDLSAGKAEGAALGQAAVRERCSPDAVAMGLLSAFDATVAGQRSVDLERQDHAQRRTRQVVKAIAIWHQVLATTAPDRKGLGRSAESSLHHLDAVARTWDEITSLLSSNEAVQELFLDMHLDFAVLFAWCGNIPRAQDILEMAMSQGDRGNMPHERNSGRLVEALEFYRILRSVSECSTPASSELRPSMGTLHHDENWGACFDSAGEQARGAWTEILERARTMEISP